MILHFGSIKTVLSGWLRNLIFFLCLFPASAQALDPARNLAILAGGNCEEGRATERNYNMFRNMMGALATGLTNSGWTVRPMYDGASRFCTESATTPRCRRNPTVHPCCPPGVAPQGWNGESIAYAAGISPEQMPSSTKASFLAALDRAIAAEPAPQQVFVAFSTHGGLSSGATAEHLLCFADGLVDLNHRELQDRFTRLRDRGVRLAFLDQSCFSGSSIDALSRFGCVLARQRRSSVGYMTGAQDALVDLLLDSPDRVSRFDLGTRVSWGMPDHRITPAEVYVRHQLEGSPLNQAQISALPDQDFDIVLDRASLRMGLTDSASCSSHAGLEELRRWIDSMEEVLSSRTLPEAVRILRGIRPEAASELNPARIARLRELLRRLGALRAQYAQSAERDTALTTGLVRQTISIPVPLPADVATYLRRVPSEVRTQAITCGVRLPHNGESSFYFDTSPLDLVAAPTTQPSSLRCFSQGQALNAAPSAVHEWLDTQLLSSPDKAVRWEREYRANLNRSYGRGPILQSSAANDANPRALTMTLGTTPWLSQDSWHDLRDRVERTARVEEQLRSLEREYSSIISEVDRISISLRLYRFLRERDRAAVGNSPFREQMNTCNDFTFREY